MSDSPAKAAASASGSPIPFTSLAPHTLRFLHMLNEVSGDVALPELKQLLASNPSFAQLLQSTPTPARHGLLLSGCTGQGKTYQLQHLYSLLRTANLSRYFWPIYARSNYVESASSPFQFLKSVFQQFFQLQHPLNNPQAIQNRRRQFVKFLAVISRERVVDGEKYEIIESDDPRLSFLQFVMLTPIHALSTHDLLVRYKQALQQRQFAKAFNAKRQLVHGVEETSLKEGEELLKHFIFFMVEVVKRACAYAKKHNKFYVIMLEDVQRLEKYSWFLINELMTKVGSLAFVFTANPPSEQQQQQSLSSFDSSNMNASTPSVVDSAIVGGYLINDKLVDIPSIPPDPRSPTTKAVHFIPQSLPGPIFQQWDSVFAYWTCLQPNRNNMPLVSHVSLDAVRLVASPADSLEELSKFLTSRFHVASVDPVILKQMLQRVSSQHFHLYALEFSNLMLHQREDLPDDDGVDAKPRFRFRIEGNIGSANSRLTFEPVSKKLKLDSAHFVLDEADEQEQTVATSSISKSAASDGAGANEVEFDFPPSLSDLLRLRLTRCLQGNEVMVLSLFALLRQGAEIDVESVSALLSAEGDEWKSPLVLQKVLLTLVNKKFLVRRQPSLPNPQESYQFIHDHYAWLLNSTHSEREIEGSLSVAAKINVLQRIVERELQRRKEEELASMSPNQRTSSLNSAVDENQFPSAGLIRTSGKKAGATATSPSKGSDAGPGVLHFYHLDNQTILYTQPRFEALILSQYLLTVRLAASGPTPANGANCLASAKEFLQGKENTVSNWLLNHLRDSSKDDSVVDPSAPPFIASTPARQQLLSPSKVSSSAPSTHSFTSPIAVSGQKVVFSPLPASPTSSDAGPVSSPIVVARNFFRSVDSNSSPAHNLPRAASMPAQSPPPSSVSPSIPLHIPSTPFDETPFDHDEDDLHSTPSRKLTRSSSVDADPLLLHLVPKNTPLLHQQAADVSFPLSTEIRDLIVRMQYSFQPVNLRKAGAPWPSGVGMAASQWGRHLRIFLFCPSGEVTDPSKCEVCINPRYEPLGSDTQLGWEGCFSVPGYRGHVRRFLHLRATYSTTEGVEVVRELHGWEARVFQHECDHTEGRLYDDAKAGKCEQFLPTTLEEFQAARAKEKAEEAQRLQAGAGAPLKLTEEVVASGGGVLSDFFSVLNSASTTFNLIFGSPSSAATGSHIARESNVVTSNASSSVLEIAEQSGEEPLAQSSPKALVSPDGKKLKQLRFADDSDSEEEREAAAMAKALSGTNASKSSAVEFSSSDSEDDDVAVPAAAIAEAPKPKLSVDTPSSRSIVASDAQSVPLPIAFPEIPFIASPKHHHSSPASPSMTREGSEATNASSKGDHFNDLEHHSSSTSFAPSNELEEKWIVVTSEGEKPHEVVAPPNLARATSTELFSVSPSQAAAAAAIAEYPVKSATQSNGTIDGSLASAEALSSHEPFISLTAAQWKQLVASFAASDDAAQAITKQALQMTSANAEKNSRREKLDRLLLNSVAEQVSTSALQVSHEELVASAAETPAPKRKAVPSFLKLNLPMSQLATLFQRTIGDLMREAGHVMDPAMWTVEQKLAWIKTNNKDEPISLEQIAAQEAAQAVAEVKPQPSVQVMNEPVVNATVKPVSAAVTAHASISSPPNAFQLPTVNEPPVVTVSIVLVGNNNIKLLPSIENSNAVSSPSASSNAAAAATATAAPAASRSAEAASTPSVASTVSPSKTAGHLPLIKPGTKRISLHPRVRTVSKNENELTKPQMSDSPAAASSVPSPIPAPAAAVSVQPPRVVDSSTSSNSTVRVVPSAATPPESVAPVAPVAVVSSVQSEAKALEAQPLPVATTVVSPPIVSEPVLVEATTERPVDPEQLAAAVSAEEQKEPVPSQGFSDDTARSQAPTAPAAAPFHNSGNPVMQDKLRVASEKVIAIPHGSIVKLLREPQKAVSIALVLEVAALIQDNPSPAIVQDAARLTKHANKLLQRSAYFATNLHKLAEEYSSPQAQTPSAVSLQLLHSYLLNPLCTAVRLSTSEVALAILLWLKALHARWYVAGIDLTQAQQPANSEAATSSSSAAPIKKKVPLTARTAASSDHGASAKTRKSVAPSLSHPGWNDSTNLPGKAAGPTIGALDSKRKATRQSSMH